MICTKCGTTVPEVELDECVGCGGTLRPSAEELLRYPKFGLVKEIRPPQIQMAKLIEEALASDVHEEVVVEGGCGVGKAQPLDAKILCPDQWRPMGAMEPGIPIIGCDGQIHQVTGVFPQGTKEVFRVTFTDGTFTTCCEEHLWSVQSIKDRARNRPGKARTLRNLLDEGLKYQSQHRHWIPIMEPARFPKQTLPLDPYLLGVLLGDGGFTSASSVHITKKIDTDIIEMLRALLPEEDCLSAYQKEGEYGIISRTTGAHTRSKVTDVLETLGLWQHLSVEKFIPKTYLWSDINDRVALLQGLCDTDGGLTQSQTNVEFGSSSKQLAEDVRFLVQSLGGVTSFKPRKPTYTYKGEKRAGHAAYRLVFTLPGGLTPFRTARKRDAYTPPTTYFPRRAITSVELIGTMETQCISTSAPDQLYITDHCIVTHNTFAYLTPALPSHARVVISTGNKMLQDQLHDKDIPTLLKVMGLDNTKLFINLKGKNNYVCKKRLRAQKQKFKRKGMAEVWDRIVAWSKEDPLGDIKRWPGVESFDSHPLYLTRVDECDKKHCKHHTECGYYNTKQKSKDADVLLINHYLLGWDLRLKGGLIFGDYDWLIVDEAHGAPDAIRSAFSKTIAQKWLSKFLEELSGEQVDLSMSNDGLQLMWDGMFEGVRVSRDPSDRVLEAAFFGDAIYAVMEHLWLLYGDVASYVQGRWADKDVQFIAPKMFLAGRRTIWQDFQDYLMWVDSKLYRRKDRSPTELEEYRTFGAVMKLMDRLVKKIEDLTCTTDEEDENVVWSHEFHNNQRTVKGEPINLAPLVSDELQSKHKLVFTSATLHEDYLSKELGLKPTRTQRWPAPFDFKSNARLYIPTHLAAPNEKNYHQDLAQEINTLVDLSEGKALVLFSAKADMAAVIEIIENEYDFGFELYAQQDGESASSITERFLEGVRLGEDPVIFGLKSFFEGFDVKGQDIQLVIITKIPFQDFKAPLNVGKKRLLGGKHWSDYYFPTMQNHIRQATGRLIRSQIDKGVVAILDTRMWIGGLGKKGLTPDHIVQAGDQRGTMQQWAASDSGWPGNYGYKIFKSLPFDNCTFEIEDVAAFFDSIKK